MKTIYHGRHGKKRETPNTLKTLKKMASAVSIRGICSNGLIQKKAAFRINSRLLLSTIHPAHHILFGAFGAFGGSAVS